MEENFYKLDNIQDILKLAEKLSYDKEELLVKILEYIINNDIRFDELVILNENHVNYESNKELVDNLQKAHDITIERIKLLYNLLKEE